MAALFKKADSNKIRRHIRFYGSVQAVGFRYRAMYAAQLYGATGWVKNEYDGSVTMEIQGLEEDIDRVIQSLEQDSYIRIHYMEAKTIPVVEDERRFRVAYY